ncbi:MAG: hypothetical protein H7343_17840 [Undibacterium sp.]|nr:hypothetical protein [Opitutaceae bacterium]
MSIDKESNGLPTVNVQRRTTKVNLWMVMAVLFFFAVMTLVAFRISRETPSPGADKRAPAETNAIPKP